MEWIGIDFSNPLILLRVFLAGIWVLPVLYGIATVLRVSKSSPTRPAIWLSIGASLLGSVSYFIGASTTFTSPIHFIWVAGLLAFTPLTLMVWFYLSRISGKKMDKLARVQKKVSSEQGR
jgi:hypothetical protein